MKTVKNSYYKIVNQVISNKADEVKTVVSPYIKQYHYRKYFNVYDFDYQKDLLKFKDLSKFIYSTLNEKIGENQLVNPLTLLEMVKANKTSLYDTISRLNNVKGKEVAKLPNVLVPLNQRKKLSPMDALVYLADRTIDVLEENKRGPYVDIIVVRNIVIGVVIAGVFFFITSEYWQYLIDKLGINEFLKWLRRFLRKLLRKLGFKKAMGKNLIKILDKYIVPYNGYGFNPPFIDEN